MKVLLLLSAGRHPASFRPCPVAVELQAIGLARALPDATCTGLHAGGRDDAVTEALGHGLDQITVLASGAENDPLPALAAEIESQKPDLILAGRRGMGGADTGLLPYRLAHACNLPIVADAIALSVESGRLAVTQALPRGARRLVTVAMPAVVTVHEAAPSPLPYVHRARLAGELVERNSETAGPRFDTPAETRPYRARPKLIGDGAAGGSAEARLRAATETANAGGQLMIGPTPEEAAEAILAHVARFRRR